MHGVKQQLDLPGVETAPVPTVQTPWLKLPQPDGSIVLRPGKPLVLGEEIGSAEAARILGLSQRRVQSLCEEGVLVEGRDWRKNPCASGDGNLRIQREAVLRLRSGEI
jgi:hypothetical protein